MVRFRGVGAGHGLAIGLLGCALLTGSAGAATVWFEVGVPAATPATDSLWLSGDRPELGSWNGAGLRLRRGAGGRFFGALSLPAGTAFEYKVTRGGWETVEKAADGSERANRRDHVGELDDTVRVEVAAWRDQTERVPVRTTTLTGDVRRHPAFPSRFVPAREVLVWLPPGYDREPKRRYPVVVFHDGQNVFDGATSFLPGREWGADETADRLVRLGRIPPCILVAVANSPHRMDEYTLDADPRHGGGGAAAYQRFLLEELLPFVDRTYRTRADAAHTAVVGSSLGGLASLDLGLRHPERVGRVGCLSPSVWWADRAVVRRAATAAKSSVRIWLDIGTAEGGSVADASESLAGPRQLRDALVGAGWREGADLHYEEVAGAAHNETAWAARFDRVLEYLLR